MPPLFFSQSCSIVYAFPALAFLFAIILFRWYSTINQKPPDFVHTHRWQFYDTDYHCSSCVTWHTSVFPSCFPSLRMTSWQAAFHWDHSWWGLSEECVDKWNGEMHLPGHVLGVCWMFLSCFFKDMTFISFCFSLVQFPQCFKETMHAMVRYNIFWLIPVCQTA